MEERVNFQHKYHQKNPGKSFRWKKKLKYVLILVLIVFVVFWFKKGKTDFNDDVIVTWYKDQDSETFDKDSFKIDHPKLFKDLI